MKCNTDNDNHIVIVFVKLNTEWEQVNNNLSCILLLTKSSLFVPNPGV